MPLRARKTWLRMLALTLRLIQFPSGKGACILAWSPNFCVCHLDHLSLVASGADTCVSHRTGTDRERVLNQLLPLRRAAERQHTEEPSHSVKEAY